MPDVVDRTLYEKFRIDWGWTTPYPNMTKPGAVPLGMVNQNLYPGEKIASFGPAKAPAVGEVIATPTTGDTVCEIGAPTPGADPAVPPQDNCKITAALPPDCESTYRCVIVFQADVDECDPTKWRCPRTLGVFCINAKRSDIKFKQWFIVDDPSWLTGDDLPCAWYLIEMPVLPGNTRLCSCELTNVAGGLTTNCPSDAPKGNYAPCSLRDLADLRELCKLADADGKVIVNGFEVTLPAGFCDNITDIINKVEEPGKNLPEVKNPDGSDLETPDSLGVCVTTWAVSWNSDGESKGTDGKPCKGGYDAPTLGGMECMSTLRFALLTLNPPVSDPDDCSLVYYVSNGLCSLLSGNCMANSRYIPLKDSDGNDICVCPDGDGIGYHECDCSTPGAVPGGYDPCDPANGYVAANAATCTGGGISVDDPAGGAGGAVTPPTEPPSGGKPSGIVEPTVIKPRDSFTQPPKPEGCPDHPCNYYCHECRTSQMTPQGWVTSVSKQCATDQNSKDLARAASCGLSGPCMSSVASSTKVKACGNNVVTHESDCQNQVASPPSPGGSFYDTCPVCMGYAQGTYSCKGNPQTLTAGSWTATFACKTGKDWAAFFAETLCNGWRMQVASFGLFECGGQSTDQNGKTITGTCPPKGYTGPRSGYNSATIDPGYQCKTTPCEGAAIMVRRRTGSQAWSPWGGGGGICTGTCGPASGKTLSCTAGTSYGSGLEVSFGKTCRPYMQKSSSSAWVMKSGDTCRQDNRLGDVRVGECEGCYQTLTVGSVTGPSWCRDGMAMCCWTTTIYYAENSEAIGYVQIGVSCPGKSVSGGASTSLVGCPGTSTKLSSSIRTTCQRVDCLQNK